MEVRALWLIAIMAGCTVAATDAGCNGYGEARLTMPRPLDDTPLGRWVAVTDSRMSGVCRGKKL